LCIDQKRRDLNEAALAPFCSSRRANYRFGFPAHHLAEINKCRQSHDGGEA
jgi:hypothetical protein